MKIKNLMTSEVKCCATYNTLNTAARIMWDNDIGCVPVVDQDGRVAGMLTDRDICMAAYIQGVPLAGSLVTTAMSKDVFFCAPDDEAAVAQKLMREKQVRRLPVIDAQGRLAGIISLSDIARHAQREARAATDAEITRVTAAICASRHRVIEARAA